MCKHCGEEINWEGEFIRRIKLCPVCNEEYEISDSFCYFHNPESRVEGKGNRNALEIESAAKKYLGITGLRQ